MKESEIVALSPTKLALQSTQLHPGNFKEFLINLHEILENFPKIVVYWISSNKGVKIKLFDKTSAKMI